MGKKESSIITKAKLKGFLEKLKLTLSEEKTLITNAKLNKAKFLRTVIKRYATNGGVILTKSKALRRNRRIPSGKYLNDIPLQAIVKRLASKGFIKQGA